MKTTAFTSSLRGALGLSTALLVLAGCATSSRISIQVPASLAATPPLPVTGKQGFKHSFQFGPFATEEVKVGWQVTTTHSLNRGMILLPVPAWCDESRAKRKSSFTMQPIGNATWQAQCAYYAQNGDLSLGNETQNTGVTVYSKEWYSALIQAPSQPAWQLALEGQTQIGHQPQFAQGTLTNGDSLLHVRPISQLLRRDGRPMAMPFGVPVGYEFARPNGSVVAAVELLGRGRVWLSPGLVPAVQGPVAAAITALLLQQQ